MKTLFILLFLVGCGRGGGPLFQANVNVSEPGGAEALTKETELYCFDADRSGSATNGFDFEYKVIRKKDGSVSVDCEVTSGGSANNSVTHSKGSEGAKKGQCHVFKEYIPANPYNGKWTFSNEKGVSKAVYTCTGCGTNNMTFQFPDGTCEEREI